MLPIGTRRRIDFRIVDIAGNPVTGRVLANWTILFTRDNVTCADALTLFEKGAGRYSVSYMPSAIGHDYLEIYDVTHDIRVIDIEDIMPSDFAIGGSANHYVTLDHDHGGEDALRLIATAPETFKVFVFLSNDWAQGRRSDSDAFGISDLDENGRWKAGIRVPAGVFHVIARKFREVHTITLNLQVGG